jgi:hypothetical protein
LANFADVRQLLGETINQVRVGRLDVKVGHTLGFLAGVLLKAIEASELERLTEESRSSRLWSRIRRRNATVFACGPTRMRSDRAAPIPRRQWAAARIVAKKGRAEPGAIMMAIRRTADFCQAKKIVCPCPARMLPQSAILCFRAGDDDESKAFGIGSWSMTWLSLVLLPWSNQPTDLGCGAGRRIDTARIGEGLAQHRHLQQLLAQAWVRTVPGRASDDRSMLRC